MVSPRLRGLPGCETFSAETGSILGKLVTLGYPRPIHFSHRGTTEETRKERKGNVIGNCRGYRTGKLELWVRSGQAVSMRGTPKPAYRTLERAQSALKAWSPYSSRGYTLLCLADLPTPAARVSGNETEPVAGVWDSTSVPRKERQIKILPCVSLVKVTPQPQGRLSISSIFCRTASQFCES